MVPRNKRKTAILAVSIATVAFLAVLAGAIHFLKSPRSPLPVQVTFQPSLRDSNTLIAIIHNHSGASPEIRVKIRRLATGESTKVDLRLFDQMTDIGSQTSWRFVSGDTLVIEWTDLWRRGEYNTLGVRVP